ncbi:hypothetical protein ACF09H_21675 [Streptomyces sp. NPDC014983]|uniref:hypothetical protein n=1 Tax=Streptomyces sp. NPDC014983 TaxID=3364933 RepID=UPI0036F8DE35
MTLIENNARVVTTEAASTSTTTTSCLRSAIVRVHRAPQRPYPTDEQRERSRQRLRAIVEPWLPLAESRLAQAAGSPSDHARWKDLVAGVQPLVTPVDPSPALTSLSDSALRLLRALRAAETEGPGVTEIADHVRTAIRDGVLLPGTKLPVGRIAADLGYSRPSDRAELAFQDLQTENLLTFRGSTWWVAEPTDQPTQIAGMIRTLIQTSVYPPGHCLRTTIELARELASSRVNLVKALAVLREEGSVVSQSGLCPVVSPVPPFTLDAPLDPDALAAQLRPFTLTDADLRPEVIEETCAQARIWWRTRTSPPAAALEHAFGYLITAVLHLLRSNSDTPKAHTRLRRTAALALDPNDITPNPLWRTACIAAIASEILGEESA